MSVTEPDSLDKDTQLALADSLAEVHIANLGQALGAAWKQGRGGGIIGRLLGALGGPGKLSVHEFIYYRLFDPALAKDKIPEFMSAKIRSAQTLACNDVNAKAPTFDKVLWDNHLVEAGLPRPELRAVFGGDTVPTSAKVLEDREALLGYLRDPARYPMLAKPIFGGRSIGILRLDAVSDDKINLHDGTERSVEDVAAFMIGLTTKGYMFQEILAPHPEIAKVTGGSLASMRALLLSREGQTRLENITLKVPRTHAVADNFWRDGNLLSAVNETTGEVTRAVVGSGVTLTEVDTHPDTGAPVRGMILPDMDALRTMTEAMAAVFPKLTLQGWDIALTNRGPVPIELNFGGDVNLQQLAHHAGGMTPAYCEHMRAAGYQGPLPH